MKKILLDNVIAILGITLCIILIGLLPSGTLYDKIKQQRLDYLKEQQYQKHLITCNKCKGTGECLTDVNKLMMDAAIALFVNNHLMVDKCKDCVKLEDGNYSYCQKVNNAYQTLLKEYEKEGPSIEMASCDKCMGMGTFTCQKPDGTYMTQKEYNEKHKQ